MEERDLEILKRKAQIYDLSRVMNQAGAQIRKLEEEIAELSKESNGEKEG